MEPSKKYRGLSRIQHLQGFEDLRVTTNAAIFMTGVVEHLCKNIIASAGTLCNDEYVWTIQDNIPRIRERHLYEAISLDPDMDKLISGLENY